MQTHIMKKMTIACLLILATSYYVQAQEIPDEYNGVIYRGTGVDVARGVMDGNLIETNYRNHGEFARWGDIPWGVWPRNIGGRHIDGVGVVVSGIVRGERGAKYKDTYFKIDINDEDRDGSTTDSLALPDTLLNPVIINYRDAGKRQSPISGELWGWLPLPGFNNPNRLDPITFARTPTPALSNDPESWPEFWPDRINEEIFGWAGSWNGLFGRGVLNADLESYYVMDDFSDMEYSLNDGTPISPFGVFYPDPNDSTMGGLGLQTRVRILQWANVLAEDVMFLLYQIQNKGGTDHDRLQFVQIVDYGLGQDETDDNAAYDPLLDVVYGWDNNGIGNAVSGGTTYPLGYSGFAFLESPADDDDLVDNDQDGITDESRFDQTFTLITDRDEMINYIAANYDRTAFEVKYGPVIDRPAYKAGIWYTSDENMDWVGFTDVDENGQWNVGETLNNDVGRDGLGTFDLGYLGPDEGEGDGLPTQGEPNYNELDVDESDQIGLTGFDLNTRPFYESGNNLRDDTWLYERIDMSRFPLGQEPESRVANDEPFALFLSGDVQLAPGEIDFFSTAWIFGNDVQDFFKNRQTVQNIYNADYNFAQPPITPTLTAEASDKQVILSWDNLSVESFDRFILDFDFEGYKLYKGTNNLLSDARTITDVNGTPTFYEPLVQFDLDNDISGPIPVLDNTVSFDLGSNTGLQFSYVDNDVQNGRTYYYALVAYDRGFIPPDTSTAPGIDPQENVFNISVNIQGEVTGTSQNAAVVIPRTKPAGFTEGGSTVDLSRITSGVATGSAEVNIVTTASIDPTRVYKVVFWDTLASNEDVRATESYAVVESNSLDTLIERSPIVETTPRIDGFTITLNNDSAGVVSRARSGWVANEGTENELFSNDASELDGFTTDWVISIRKPFSNGAFVNTDTDYELLFTGGDSLYRSPFVRGSAFSRDSIPVFAYVRETGEQAPIFFSDNDQNDELSAGDILTIASFAGRFPNFHYEVTITEGTIAPTSGNKVIITSSKQFGVNDYFQFTMDPGNINDDLASEEMSDIYVVPNPYIGTATWERNASSLAIGRGERKIAFFNLPRECTIRIFNVRGELIKTINHSGSLTNGQAYWDLKTDFNEEIAYGVYYYHVKSDGVGEFKDKFAVIK